MQTLLFIHGWPDDSSVWSHQFEALKQKYNCLFFELPRVKKDFPEIVDLVAEMIKGLGTPVVLIGHDWGAYISYMVQKKYPELVKSLITLDVGGDTRPQSLLQGIGLVSYQLWLTSAWFLKDHLPNLSSQMSRSFASAMKAPDSERVTSDLNYLYYYFWRNTLNPKFRKHNLQGFRPRGPLMYIYGTEKPLMFHSRQWVRLLKSLPECEVHALTHSLRPLDDERRGPEGERTH